MSRESILPKEFRLRLFELRVRDDIRRKVAEGRWRPLVRTQRKAAAVDDGLTWIYFVQAGADGPIKIGSAQDVEGRIRNLQVSSHVELRLLGVVRATPLHEGELHDRFSESRLRGEWFEPTAELLAHIAEVSD